MFILCYGHRQHGRRFRQVHCNRRNCVDGILEQLLSPLTPRNVELWYRSFNVNRNYGSSLTMRTTGSFRDIAIQLQIIPSNNHWRCRDQFRNCGCRMRLKTCIGKCNIGNWSRSFHFHYMKFWIFVKLLQILIRVSGAMITNPQRDHDSSLSGFHRLELRSAYVSNME